MSEPATGHPASAETAVPQTSVVKATESAAVAVAATEPQPGTPVRRLVIRVKIIPGGQPEPQPADRRRSSRGALLLILGAVAVLLSWVGIRIFSTDPTSAPASIEMAPHSEPQPSIPAPARSEAAPVASDEPLPKGATETTEAKSAEAELRPTEAKPAEPGMREQPDALPSPVNEVIPDVPQSALDTIRGTVRVVVRVIVDKKGTVLIATADDPGPSRYFERLAVEAAEKWTFTPASSEDQRIILVRFNFTGAGTTARADSVH